MRETGRLVPRISLYHFPFICSVKLRDWRGKAGTESGGVRLRIDGFAGEVLEASGLVTE